MPAINMKGMKIKILNEMKLNGPFSTTDIVNPFMHNVVKWPNILKNLAVFTPQDF